MIKIEETEVVGLRHVIRGMRNPMNSWEQSDSGICKGGDNGLGCENCANEASCTNNYDHEFKVGKEDYCLMEKLRDAGTDHRKYMRMIVVYLDITAPLYWWKELTPTKWVLSLILAPRCTNSARSLPLMIFNEHLIRDWGGEIEDNKFYIIFKTTWGYPDDDGKAGTINSTGCMIHR